MSQPSELIGVMLQLTVGGQPALFLALTRDGAVNRAGSGHPNAAERDVFMGQAPGPFFEQLVELVGPSWLEQSVVYHAPEQRGASCVLTLTFFLPDGSPQSRIVTEFHYGAESAGPPIEVQTFVARAIEVTQDWYAGQLTQAHRPKRPAEKPWWRFW